MAKLYLQSRSPLEDRLIYLTTLHTSTDFSLRKVIQLMQEAIEDDMFKGCSNGMTMTRESHSNTVVRLNEETTTPTD